jgi:predicted nucleotide-binding protein
MLLEKQSLEKRDSTETKGSRALKCRHGEKPRRHDDQGGSPMPLPVRTALADIEAICRYLVTKAEGATPAMLAAALGDNFDLRKLFALKLWGLVADDGSAIRLTERGQRAVREGAPHRESALQEVVATTPPYAAVIASAVARSEPIVLASDVAAHWHQHFKADCQFGILNHQTVCFFRIAEGAGLGRLLVGRRGQQTRFELAEAEARAFVEATAAAAPPRVARDGADGGSEAGVPTSTKRERRVFITHRSGAKIIEQVKELIAFGNFEPVVAKERGAAARPFLHELMDEMRGCDTAVIHVGTEGASSGLSWIGGDALIELGAAMALYGRNFILLVEEGVELPSNLRGLSECRYSGDGLDMAATMNLLKAFNELTQAAPSRRLALAIGPDHVVPHLFHYERAVPSARG